MRGRPAESKDGNHGEIRARNGDVTRSESLKGPGKRWNGEPVHNDRIMERSDKLRNEAKRKIHSFDEEKPSYVDRPVLKKHDSARFRVSKHYDINDARREYGKPYREEPRSKRRRSRSRDHDQGRRDRSLSLSPREQRRSYHGNDHDNYPPGRKYAENDRYRTSDNLDKVPIVSQTSSVSVSFSAPKQNPATALDTILSGNSSSIDSVQLTQATRPLRRLHIENLTSSTSEDMLIGCLNDFLLSSGVNRIQRSKQPCLSCTINKEKRQAFVEFLTPEDATAALSFDGRSFNGSTLRIRRPKEYIEMAVLAVFNISEASCMFGIYLQLRACLDGIHATTSLAWTGPWVLPGGCFVCVHVKKLHAWPGRLSGVISLARVKKHGRKTISFPRQWY
uniref:Splicing factor U2AF 65 kDa subunit n=1 Tax=Aegilops tauschii TaxID=37682 RepID=R7VYN3_AEGTA